MYRKYFITIADDDLDDQFLLKDALRETGLNYAVASVYNGLQLMDLLLKREAYGKNVENPDLIFLDLNMPLMDGFEVLREIRDHEQLASIPVYILSTGRNDYDADRAKELGARGYYVKPANFEGLKNILTQIFDEALIAS